MPKSPQRTVWARLEEALREANKPAKQVYVAEQLGITQPSVSEWNGSYPSMENAVAAARLAGVCVQWLYEENGPKRPPPVDPLAERLWQFWVRLDDATKGELIGIASKAAGPPGENPSAAPRLA